MPILEPFELVTLLGRIEAGRLLRERVGNRAWLERGLDQILAGEEKGEGLPVGLHSLDTVPGIISSGDLHPNGTLYSDQHIKTALAYTAPVLAEDREAVEVLVKEYMTEKAAGITGKNLDALLEDQAQCFLKSHLALLARITRMDSIDVGTLETLLNHFNQFLTEFHRIDTDESLDVPGANEKVNNEYVSSYSLIKGSFSDEENDKFLRNDSNEKIELTNVLKRMAKLESRLKQDDPLFRQKERVFSAAYEVIGQITSKEFTKNPFLSPPAEYEQKVGELARTCVDSAVWTQGEVLHAGRNPKKELKFIRGFERVTKSLIVTDIIHPELVVVYKGAKHGKDLGSGAFGKAKLGQLLSPEHPFFVLKVMKKTKPASGKKEEEQLSSVNNLIWGAVRTNSENSTYEILMPYKPGKSIRDMEMTSVYSCYRLLQGALSAFTELHDDMHVLHLDIKSENFLFDRAELDVNQTVHPIDFGFSEKMNNKGLATAGWKGTSRYMAPEIYGNSEKKLQYDEAVDVYALGMTLAEFFGMTERNPIYKGIANTEDRQARAESLFASGNPDVGLLRVSMTECSENFRDVVSSQTLREDLRELFINMTDPDANERPSFAECMDRLGKFPEFQECSPDVGVLEVEVLQDLIARLSLMLSEAGLELDESVKESKMEEINDCIRDCTETLSHFDYVVLSGRPGFNEEQSSELLHQLSVWGVGNACRSIMVSNCSATIISTH